MWEEVIGWVFIKGIAFGVGDILASDLPVLLYTVVLPSPSYGLEQLHNLIFVKLPVMIAVCLNLRLISSNK